MKQWQVLKTIFPEVIAENFEFVNYVESSDRLDYWLDERGYMSKEDYKKGTARGVWFYRRACHPGLSYQRQSGLSTCPATEMA